MLKLTAGATEPLKTVQYFGVTTADDAMVFTDRRSDVQTIPKPYIQLPDDVIGLKEFSVEFKFTPDASSVAISILFAYGNSANNASFPSYYVKGSDPFCLPACRTRHIVGTFKWSYDDTNLRKGVAAMFIDGERIANSDGPQITTCFGVC